MDVQVSAIVPFYQAEWCVRRCIEGLLNQDLGSEHYEILMIDNNSTDRSVAIVDEYSDSAVTLLREPKQGAYAARNRGLAEARGEVIVFTDPDCVPRHDWLRLLTQPLECPDVEIVMGRALLDVHSRALQTLQDYEKSKDEQIYGGDDVLVYVGRTNNESHENGTPPPPLQWKV